MGEQIPENSVLSGSKCRGASSVFRFKYETRSEAYNGPTYLKRPRLLDLGTQYRWAANNVNYVMTVNRLAKTSRKGTQEGFSHLFGKAPDCCLLEPFGNFLEVPLHRPKSGNNQTKPSRKR